MNTHSSNAIADIELSVIKNEPRARDLDIAKRLGFSKPTNIRNLIKRNLVELERFGICFTAKQNHKGGRGRPTDEYWLNEEQSLLIAVLSDTENAADVRYMLIKVFVAFRRGQISGNLNLDPESRHILGGMIKRNAGVVVRQELEPVHADLHAMREEIADLREKVRPDAIRRQGVPAKTVWDTNRLPPLKCGTVWLGNKLMKMGAGMEFGQRADIGGKAVRLFDPDRAKHCMENGLLNTARKYVAERQGQGKLNLNSTGKDK
ncbi:hypothetical protein [Agrobacterium sp. SUL3]|uniref:hypothetical protein n=1 Tax=Agrobacterium sp. SUL3 TaxID=1701910 RepID=UPI00069A96E0|nr:hypothetical protein [Agrobacterium sp. SUL3]